MAVEVMKGDIIVIRSDGVFDTLGGEEIEGGGVNIFEGGGLIRGSDDNAVVECDE